MKYRVKIVETLAMTIEVEAPSAEEAVNHVENKYRNEEIVVESSAKPDVEFIVSPIGVSSSSDFVSIPSNSSK